MQLLHVTAGTGRLGLLTESGTAKLQASPCTLLSQLSIMLTEGSLGIFLQMTVYYYIIPSYTS